MTSVHGFLHRKQLKSVHFNKNQSFFSKTCVKLTYTPVFFSEEHENDNEKLWKFFKKNFFLEKLIF